MSIVESESWAPDAQGLLLTGFDVAANDLSPLRIHRVNASLSHYETALIKSPENEPQRCLRDELFGILRIRALDGAKVGMRTVLDVERDCLVLEVLIPCPHIRKMEAGHSTALILQPVFERNSVRDVHRITVPFLSAEPLVVFQIIIFANDALRSKG